MKLFRRKKVDSADLVESESLVTDVLAREGLSAQEAVSHAERRKARHTRSPEELLRAARSVA